MRRYFPHGKCAPNFLKKKICGGRRLAADVPTFFVEQKMRMLVGCPLFRPAKKGFLFAAQKEDGNVSSFL